MCYMFIFLFSCKVFSFLGAWSNEYLRIVPTSHVLHGNNSYLFGGFYIVSQLHREMFSRYGIQ